MNNISSYKDLVVWQKSFDLSLLIYKITSTFPKDESYGLISQMRRSAISIPSNVAEGSIRGSKKDFCHFLRIASGSLAELQTQIEISKSLNYIKILDYNKTYNLSVEINKMIHGLIKKLAQ